MIYQHAVVTKPPPSRAGMTLAGEAIMVNRRQYANGTPPLTRTSRMTREEALPIFYSQNAFYIQVEDIQLLDLYAWLRRIDRRYLGCLQHVQVVVNPPPANRGQYVVWLLSETIPPPIDVDPLRWLKMEEELTSTAKINLAYSLQSEQCKLFALAIGIGRARRQGGVNWDEVARDISDSLGARAREDNMTWRMNPDASLWWLNDNMRIKAGAAQHGGRHGEHRGTMRSKPARQEQTERTFFFSVELDMSA
jgi:hypothetical protein